MMGQAPTSKGKKKMNLKLNMNAISNVDQADRPMQDMSVQSNQGFNGSGGPVLPHNTIDIRKLDRMQAAQILDQTRQLRQDLNR